MKYLILALLLINCVTETEIVEVRDTTMINTVTTEYDTTYINTTDTIKTTITDTIKLSDDSFKITMDSLEFVKQVNLIKFKLIEDSLKHEETIAKIIYYKSIETIYRTDTLYLSDRE